MQVYSDIKVRYPPDGSFSDVSRVVISVSNITNYHPYPLSILHTQVRCCDDCPVKDVSDNRGDGIASGDAVSPQNRRFVTVSPRKNMSISA